MCIINLTCVSSPWKLFPIIFLSYKSTEERNADNKNFKAHLTIFYYGNTKSCFLYCGKSARNRFIFMRCIIKRKFLWPNWEGSSNFDFLGTKRDHLPLRMSNILRTSLHRMIFYIYIILNALFMTAQNYNSLTFLWLNTGVFW